MVPLLEQNSHGIHVTYQGDSADLGLGKMVVSQGWNSLPFPEVCHLPLSLLVFQAPLPRKSSPRTDPYLSLPPLSIFITLFSANFALSFSCGFSFLISLCLRW